MELNNKKSTGNFFQLGSNLAASLFLTIMLLAIWFPLGNANAAGVQLRNYWKNNQYLNVETGGIRASTIEQGWWSAQWFLESVPGLPTMYRMKNRWTSQYLHIEHGYLEMGAIQPGWHSAMWSFKHSAMGSNIFNIQNRWKSTYLHIEYGRLEIGSIQPGWHSAGWTTISIP